jgi:hypothetical protein
MPQNSPPAERQYEIEFGPFNVTPVATAGMSDTDTNVNYVRVRWGGVNIALIFSKHMFSTRKYQTTKDENSLWLVNLQPTHIALIKNGPGRNVDIRHMPLGAPGCITHLSWGREYIVQLPDQPLGVWFRAVDLHPTIIDDVPPMNTWDADPAKFMLEPADQIDENVQAAMPGLLFRLGALSAS